MRPTSLERDRLAAGGCVAARYGIAAALIGETRAALGAPVKEVELGELDDQKLPHLIELKYHAVADAVAELGQVATIREMFIGFQKHLYEARAAS